MKKILLIWDVKSGGSPATSFYRALRGYDYRSKSGKSHSNGVLDELPEGVWEFVSRSAIIVERRYTERVEQVFRQFSGHVIWRRFEVRG
ncbi:MAG: hypothetical protein NZ934_01135 [Hadesarchaea archaeon]|nr:hypothetical protein [Hadesarchaea archaeon]